MAAITDWTTPPTLRGTHVALEPLATTDATR